MLAGHLVEAHRIGSSETDRTLVGISVDPDLAAQVTHLCQEHQKLMMEVSGSQSVLGITSPNDREQLQRLLARTPATHLDSVEAQLQQLRGWLREAEEVQARVDEIAAKTEQQLSCGRIRARQDLFSDVQVQIGPRVRHVTEWITGGCEFYRSDGRVQWRAMDA